MLHDMLQLICQTSVPADVRQDVWHQPLCRTDNIQCFSVWMCWKHQCVCRVRLQVWRRSNRWYWAQRWFIYVSHLKPKPDLCPCFQRGGRHQTLRHLQDHHRLRVRRALQPLLVPQRPGASLQERLLDPTQRPAECKSSLPGPGPLSEPDPAPQMNPPPALRDTNQGGEKKLNFHSNALEKQKKKKL